MQNVIVVDHPLVRHALTRLRDQHTGPLEFRRLLGEISLFIGYELGRAFETVPLKIQTPLEAARGARLRRKVVLVPILRAGLGMLHPLLHIFPHARVGFIGFERDEKTLEPRRYYEKLPKNLARDEVILMDPMLATGGTLLAAMELLAGHGAKRVQLLTLLAAPEGIGRLHEKFPHLAIYTAALDRRLNKKGYILPGLGDAGDRLFGTA